MIILLVVLSVLFFSTRYNSERQKVGASSSITQHTVSGYLGNMFFYVFSIFMVNGAIFRSDRILLVFFVLFSFPQKNPQKPMLELYSQALCSDSAEA